MADGVCGVGVTGEAGSDTTIQEVLSNSGSMAFINGTVSGEQPCLKRPRTSDQLDSHQLCNGFVDINNDSCNLDSPPNLSDISKALRARFDSKFKFALKEKMVSYLSMIESTEQSVFKLNEEVKQLISRMDHIEASAEQLTKLINDRLPLPNPTNGVGQQRQLSSQAPRLPPPPPLVSAPDGLVSKSVPSNSVFLLNNQNVSTSLPTPHSGQSVITALLTSPLTPVKLTQKKVDMDSNAPSVLAKVVDMHDNDTIDLTNDTSSTDLTDDIIATAQSNMTKTARDNVLSSLSENTLPTAKTAPTSHYPVDPKLQQQWTNIQNPVPSKKTAQISNYVAQPLNCPVNFIPNVHILPVARLPPTPSYPNAVLYSTPIQPLPQLTIAEATEGICLQWTVGPQNHPFEPASAYEIYSYASSEVTMESLKTHLPWKKVGEVVALPLPMACTLTHVQANNMYYFIVRSTDRFGRYSEWSNVVNAYVS